MSPRCDGRSISLHTLHQPYRWTGSEAETTRLACAHPALGQRHQRHLRYAKAAQPPHRAPAPNTCSARWRKWRQAGAMHGHRPCNLRFAPQGGKLQPETARVPEGRRFDTVLNYPRRPEPPADRHARFRATPFHRIVGSADTSTRFVVDGLRSTSHRQKTVIRGDLKAY